MVAMLQAAVRAAPNACAPLVIHEYHEFLASNLPLGAMAFVVLREPCERFASIYDELRKYQPATTTKMPRSDEAYLRIANGTQGVLAWAKLLLDGEGSLGLIDKMIRFKKSLFQNNLGMSTYIHMWKQQRWVAPQRTAFACLPSLHADINAILARHAPGCQLPAHDSVDNVHRHPEERPGNQSQTPHTQNMLQRITAARPSPELCRMVDALYPEDVALWNSQCGTATGSAGRLAMA